MEKIAVISDIHGNMQALNAVLTDINHRNINRIFCLGDYAMAGPEPTKTLNYFMNNSDKFTMIQGNTDDFIANYNNELFTKISVNAPIMANALKHDISVLDKSQTEFLKNLPEQIEITVENTSILLVHGSPRSNSENIFPDMPLSQIEEMLQNTKSDIVLCGHTHIPCGYQTDTKQTVINVGSVGRPFTDNPQACYLILTVENDTFSAEHILLDYDKITAAKILAEQKFTGSDKLSEMLINPKLRHL